MIGYESNMLIYLTFLNNTIDNIATLNLKNQFTALKGDPIKMILPIFSGYKIEILPTFVLHLIFTFCSHRLGLS
jgi:hypothetical protein